MYVEMRTSVAVCSLSPVPLTSGKLLTDAVVGAADDTDAANPFCRYTTVKCGKCKDKRVAYMVTMLNIGEIFLIQDRSKLVHTDLILPQMFFCC